MESEVKGELPKSYPLKTLDELQSRKYFESFHFPFNKSSVPLPQESLESRPRMLVCHDMMGGYTENDRWVQGSQNEDAFAVWHWHLMDVFVYFSHNLVTLPPPCWTNAGHKHGVKVLGTFITEGNQGSQICDVLLASSQSVHMYADRLVELAVKLGFDGWLLNMEVTLESEQIPNLLEFVRYLTMAMHNALPGSLIIWYDSVTKDGDLSWQNELNADNKPFFDVCDGIFLNYSWEEDYPKRSADVAKERHYDVYMGIDVFGRGTFGGGQWKTNVAVKVAMEAAVSVALFAPGWVYETKQPPNFQEANDKFWNLISQYWPSAQSYPKLLPFFSNFDQGHAFGVYMDGNLISDRSWSNISCQSFQPLLEISSVQKKDQLHVSRNFRDAYKGGTCIAFNGSMEEGDHYIIKLFEGSALLGSSLSIEYSVKSEGTSQVFILLLLKVSKSSTDGMMIFLVPEDAHVIHADKIDNSFGLQSKRYYQCAASTLKDNNAWQVRKFVLNVNLDGLCISAVYAVCCKGICDASKVFKASKENSFEAYGANFQENEPSTCLGHIALSLSDKNPAFPLQNVWTVTLSNEDWYTKAGQDKELSVKISWQLAPKWSASDKNNYLQEFLRYDIYVSKMDSENDKVDASNRASEKREYIGVAVVQMFYVSQLKVPANCKSIKFVVQPCNVYGKSQPLGYCPYVSISAPTAA